MRPGRLNCASLHVAFGIAVLATLGYAVVPGAQTADIENIILGRPADDSIAIHVLAVEGTRVFAEFGTGPGAYTERTDAVEASVDNIAAIDLEGLSADTRYFYRLTYQDTVTRMRAVAMSTASTRNGLPAARSLSACRATRIRNAATSCITRTSI